ncbi:hypothetical protein Gogos_020530 [Gossypium gossypioides]|uniref:Aminotransferase-like plant mobile domain-containing protein n=1 Tax=Gossypium gossypioides TaxID=34282 RepID=A0A7J9D441_GOSGO|nr:hypothetical protein [Gossypium gossypioides]
MISRAPLIPDKSRNLVHLKWLLKLVNFREAGELSWGSTMLVTLYRKMCQAKQPLMVELWAKLCGTTGGALRYTTFVRSKIGSGDKVMQQFRFKQTILLTPQDIEYLHNIDLWERIDENWPTFHAEYTNLWNNRYDFLPTREAIIALKLACDPEYMPWFRHHGKPYLLAEEARVICIRRWCRKHPSSQPPVPRAEDIRWQLRSTLQSTTDEGEEDERPRLQPIRECRRNDEDEKASIQLEL